MKYFKISINEYPHNALSSSISNIHTIIELTYFYIIIFKIISHSKQPFIISIISHF
jgi:hypothetical protein